MLIEDKQGLHTIILALGVLLAFGLSATATMAWTMRDPDVSRSMEFLTALGRHDFESAGGMLDDDAVIDLPYAGEGMTVRGRAAAIDFFKRTMGRSVVSLEYRLDWAYPSSQAGALLLEVSTHGRTAQRREYANRLVAIFEYRNGRIVLFREYFNPGKVGQ
jgi:ketosteroid isomerase-like protein